MTTTRLVAALTLVLGWSTVVTSGQDLPRPEGWKWVTDTPVTHVTSGPPREGQWVFGVMAPGWHITTRPGVVLFEPAFVGRGRFTLEAETFLFPSSSGAGVGLFVGGRDLESPASTFTAFLIRRDGQFAIEERVSGRSRMLVEWTPALAAVALAATADAPVQNVLRVDVEPSSARFFVNGKTAGEVLRPLAESTGIVGMRIGAGIDLHVANFDLTLKAALPRSQPR
jgi:hypothetical protein